MKTARVLPVLMYHHVSPSPGLVTVSPGNFRIQMEEVARAGWNTVTAADIANFLAGSELPARSLAITFDDGYLDNYVHAFPVLREFSLHATIFAVTGWIAEGAPRSFSKSLVLPDHRGCKAAIGTGHADEVMMRWSEIENMLRDGVVEIHSHTHSHTRWDKTMPDVAARRIALAQDLASSRASLKQHLGMEDEHLCWPQGYFDDDYVTVASESGFKYLYTTQRKMNSRQTPPTAIGRIDTRDKGHGWLLPRLNLYTMPVLGNIYCRMRGG